jgi:hypothetical protein
MLVRLSMDSFLSLNLILVICSLRQNNIYRQNLSCTKQDMWDTLNRTGLYLFIQITINLSHCSHQLLLS